MLFLSPILLWFLAAAAIPIAIHLLNKRRHKTIQWAAMSFLLKATRESRGKKKLRHFLILACRALALAALALAAARPVASGLIGWGGGSIDTVVLILDRSASMEARPGDGLAPRRQLVLEKVRDTLKDLGSPRLVLIDSASGEPHDVPSPDTLPDLSTTSATDTRADFPSLLSRAAEFLDETPGRSEIWLASDLQNTNWLPGDERWSAALASLSSLPQKPPVRILSLTGPAAQNVSLRLLSSRRSGGELLLDLELLRAENARGTATIPLTTHLGGSRTTDNLTVPAQALRFQKRIPIPPDSESGHGYLSIPADGNPRDNAAFFSYGPALPVKSLVVSSPGESADYLSLSASPPGFAGQSSERIDPAQIASHSTADLSLIIWSAPLPTGPEAEVITRFLTSGGHVLFLPPAPSSDVSFLDHQWSPVTTAESGKFFILGDWNHTDGPLRDGIDGTPIPADRLRAIRRQIPLGDSAPLARWEDGEPFLTRQIVDQGTAWFMGSIPDYTWSNLGDADVLLPAIQRILLAGSERFDASHITFVGNEAASPLPGESVTRLDDYDTAGAAGSTFEAGIFRIGSRVIAVNRPIAEDDPEILSKEQLDSLFADYSYTLLDQPAQTTGENLSTDLWRTFLIAVLFFLIAEAILSLPKRNTERRLQPTSPQPSPR